MNSYNINKDNYDTLGVSKYGIVYEYAEGKKTIYKPQTKEQSNLNQDSFDANLSSYINRVIGYIFLLILLGLIVLSYLICYFTLKNRYPIDKIFSYILLLWIILLFLHICYSYYLYKYAVHLRDRVEKEIPHETKYN